MFNCVYTVASRSHANCIKKEIEEKKIHAWVTFKLISNRKSLFYYQNNQKISCSNGNFGNRPILHFTPYVYINILLDLESVIQYS